MLVRTLIFAILLFSFLANPLLGQEEEKSTLKEQFTDPQDSAFDISSWMSQVYGFVPIVALITEPAVGFGGVFGILNIQRKKSLGFNNKPIPPDMWVLGGAYTQNETWLTFFDYQGYWNKDRIRFRGTFSYFSLNLAVYQEIPNRGVQEFKFNMEGPAFLPSLKFRIAGSNFFLGADYVYLNNKVVFERSDSIPFPTRDLDATLSGIGANAMYDSRDNTFTPNRGIFSEFKFSVFNETIGSDLNYNRLDWNSYGFFEAGRNVLGLRGSYAVALREPPFYALPYVVLRGVPLFRYQGKHVLVVEADERWDFSPRWSLVGFLGVGKGFGSTNDFNTPNELAYSVGSGFRYFLSRLFNIYWGVDVARGPEQWAIYFQFGHYWNML